MSGVMANIEKKSGVMDEEFNNFMLKVNEVSKLIEGLTSKDNSVADDTIKLVDNYLGDPEKVLEDIDEDSLKVKTCKTVINQKAFDNMGKESSNQQQTQSPESFMRVCEEDAKQRTEQRKQHKEASDTFKKQAVDAYNKGEFERALSFYNKAIIEFRSSAHLYQCRALTCLKLKLYKRTIEDCDVVLRCFDEKSFKALLYKAKAHQALGEDEESNKCVKEAIAHHPKSEEEICEYMNSRPEMKN